MAVMFIQGTKIELSNHRNFTPVISFSPQTIWEIGSIRVITINI